MKTTVELPDELLREAKSYAAKRGVPLREVFETGLRQVLHPAKRPSRFQLKTITVKGEGLQIEGGWQAIRSAIYRGQGG